MTQQDMATLAERCEKATGHDLDLDHAIGKALSTDGNYSYRPYTASLDAAMTLVPEGYNWQVGVGNHAWAAVYKGFPPSMRVDPIAATPALALCAAALRSRNEQREG